MPNEGDFVRIQMNVANLGETPEYMFGKIIELQSGNMFVKVELSEPYKGAKFTSIPRYLAKRITEEEYIRKTGKNWIDNPKEIGECNHSWEFTGESAVFGTKWFNCSKCGIAKENV